MLVQKTRLVLLILVAVLVLLCLVKKGEPQSGYGINL